MVKFKKFFTCTSRAKKENSENTPGIGVSKENIASSGVPTGKFAFNSPGDNFTSGGSNGNFVDVPLEDECLESTSNFVENCPSSDEKSPQSSSLQIGKTPPNFNSSPNSSASQRYKRNSGSSTKQSCLHQKILKSPKPKGTSIDDSETEIPEEKFVQVKVGRETEAQPKKFNLKITKHAVAPEDAKGNRVVGLIDHFDNNNDGVICEKIPKHRVQLLNTEVFFPKQKMRFIDSNSLNSFNSEVKSPIISPREFSVSQNAALGSFHRLMVDGKGAPFSDKIYKFGEKGSGIRTSGKVQDFYELRDYHLENGTLFEDPEFPATDQSIFYSSRSNRNYEWKRPSEIVDDPQLFVEGYSRFDVQQGELGDCWLLAAVANLTLYRRLFFQIVPDDQGFDEKYAGIFHFRFWQYGKWIDVVIDDRLPTYRGQLVFLHSTEQNEFWSALLEKAYAKLHGSYEALKGGSTCEAMEDFTGGVTEMYELDAAPPNLFKIILKAFERCSLMGCSLEPDPNVLEAETPEGLIRGHAYSVTRVRYVEIHTPGTSGKIPLLRLRNPWGNEAEWNGAWSDKSPEWRYIPDHEKEELGLNFDDDGEFWMSFKDFQRHFNRLEICNLNPDSLTSEEVEEGQKKRWNVSFFEGEWVRGVTAGGCRNYLDTFWHNPQYTITLTEVDEDDDDGKCTLIVALMQKNRRSRKHVGEDILTIGFAIYHLPYPNRVPKPLDLKFFKYNASVARSPSFINLREVSCRFKLPPGTYCIVPSTFEPNEEAEFLLRVFSEHSNNMEENDEKISFVHGDVRNDQDTTIPETRETDEAREAFLRMAGENMEVGWQGLKNLLDCTFQYELETVVKDHANSLDAAPNQTMGPNGENNLLTTILGLICGAVCKDTPLADIIPQPAEATVLNAAFETNSKGFSKDNCRSMIAMLDEDKSGKLGYQEYKTLLADIKNWRAIFKKHDLSNSCTLSAFELRQAMHNAGYKLNNHILNILMHRYGNSCGEMNFDDFVMCAIKIKIMMEIFKKKCEENSDQAQFTMDEFVEATLYS